MTREQAEREVKSRYPELLRPARRKGFICPLCNNGSGQDGDGIVVDPKAQNKYTLHCFKCGFHGSIVDLYQQEHNCTTGEAFRALYDYFGLDVEKTTARNAPQSTLAESESKRTAAPQDAAEGQIEPFEGVPDFMPYIRSCKGHISDPAAQSYLAFRGISQDTAARYWLGYDPATKHLIVPVSSSFYIARSVNPEAEQRYMNPTGAKAEIFNKAALYNEDGRPVFVTEGAIDALSIIEAGGEAVALNSTSNVRKLLDVLDDRRTSKTLILCLDTDPSGEGTTPKLAAELKERNVPYTVAEILGEYKDPNEALVGDRSAFIAAVGAAERATVRPDNVADYIAQGMAAEIETLKEQRNRKTGFSNLDREAGSIYSGLYVIGGISSVGKTTFSAQLADQMAAEGQHVLFFSMEQSRLEMVSKSIARQMARIDPHHAVSSLQIRTGATGEGIKRATAEYLQSVGDRISVIEGNMACTVSFISEYTRRYIEKNNVRPCVFVDYLQVLQPDKDRDTGRKLSDPRQIVDQNITQLKRMSRSMEIPVFVISSLNRSNYLSPVDFESFKESGAIEFTADCVWGLQLSAIHDPIFEREKDIVKKRERIAEAKAAVPREVELCCLKNRYGISRYTVQFTYFPANDYFQPKVAKTIKGFTDYAGASPWDGQRKT